MKHQTLSVIIAAKNEAHQIADCIASVRFADEIIVLDSGSSDDTPTRAGAAGAQVYRTDWPGYGQQQQRGIALAHGDWVLSLDADERISAALQAEILQAIQNPRAAGYRLPRLSNFCGTFMRAGGWTPDYTLRLARTSLAGFTDHFLHAHMTVKGKRADLTQPIIHYSYRSLDDVLEKLLRYSRGAAQDMRQRGRRASLTRTLISATWAFFRSYVLQRGFIDGKMGLVLAIYNAQLTYYKYLRVWMHEASSQ